MVTSAMVKAMFMIAEFEMAVTEVEAVAIMAAMAAVFVEMALVVVMLYSR